MKKINKKWIWIIGIIVLIVIVSFSFYIYKMNIETEKQKQFEEAKYCEQDSNCVIKGYIGVCGETTDCFNKDKTPPNFEVRTIGCDTIEGDLGGMPGVLKGCKCNNFRCEGWYGSPWD